MAAHQQTYGGIYLSSDKGNTWTLLPAADQTLSWQSVTIDSTGEHSVMLIMSYLNLFSFHLLLHLLSFPPLALSHAGARITAVASTVGEYHSTDFGKTFTKGTLPSGVSYKAIAGTLSLMLILFMFALQCI